MQYLRMVPCGSQKCFKCFPYRPDHLQSRSSLDIFGTLGRGRLGGRFSAGRANGQGALESPEAAKIYLCLAFTSKDGVEQNNFTCSALTLAFVSLSTVSIWRAVTLRQCEHRQALIKAAEHGRPALEERPRMRYNVV